MAKMRIVKPKSRSTYRLNHFRDAWKTVLEIDLKDVPDDIALTTRARNRSHRKFYRDFKTLREEDIMSILSAYKRDELMLQRTRIDAGTAYYRIY